MKTTSMLAAIAVALASGGASAQEMMTWSAPTAATGGQYAYFPMGTELRLATRTELNTKQSRAGDRFYLEVVEPLLYRGQVVVPVGSVAVGEVMRSERNGHFGKRGELQVRMLSVQTPSGPVRLTGRSGREGTGQGVLAIGGAALVAWPMFLIHGTSGRLPADSAVTAYLADDLRFAVDPRAPGAAPVAIVAETPRMLPARFDPSVFRTPGR